MIVIVDYNVGNLNSISNILKKIGFASIITSDREEIRKAEKLILPGVGSFDYAMSQLKKKGLVDILNEMVLEKHTPILGICLGMQLMTKCSEEGSTLGLGWIDAEVKKFSSEIQLPIPHMGWNYVKVKKNSRLTTHFDDTFRYYFVHSYYVDCYNPNDVLLESVYGHHFVSAFSHDNIYGAQFHPEKSHKYGFQMFKNFANI